MRKNKWIAVTLAATLALTIVALPSTGMQVNAATTETYDGVYVDNQTDDISSVSISTPPISIIQYTGLTWEQVEAGVSVRLNVSDSECGAAARESITGLAANYGGTVVQYLDMDLEEYLNGWTQDVVSTVEPLRVAISLPETADTSLDYAIIVVQDDGSLRLFSDLDSNLNTVTIDCTSFDTYAIISGQSGAFDACQYVSDTALSTYSLTDYAKTVGTNVDTATNCAYIYAVGVKTDRATVDSLVGSNPSLIVNDNEPGSDAKYALQQAMVDSGAKRISYINVDLENGYSVRTTSTTSPIRLTITVPYNFPVFGDYALAVLNEDGSVTILNDLDSIQSTITVDTDQFREYAILWGPLGTFSTTE